ncbi:hypothetical protein EDD86DRAFT_77063 [Gorgonomyces haynaldii]|nr:hypothetical protein EDD86DRAFT_77063 [Gorgonomyces haynaldii]
MKRTFKWLKIQLSKMERALANEVLKRLSPNEAKLLRDPVFQSRIRFRLGGSEFPPKILFKIYTKGMNVHYFSGHRIITAHSQVPKLSKGSRRLVQCHGSKTIPGKGLSGRLQTGCIQDWTAV